MAGEGHKTRPAKEIPVTLFRQILLVPFAIEAVGKLAMNNRSNLRQRVVEALAKAPERWQLLDEPLLHLPEDQEAATLTGKARARALAEAYEEFVYFEPYVQDFLFGTTVEDDAPALQVWRLKGKNSIDIEYDLRQPPPDTDTAPEPQAKFETFRFALDRCNLYVLSTGNLILVIELRLEGCWRDGTLQPIISLEETLSLLESVRRMFPPYFPRSVEDGSTLSAIYYPRRIAFVEPGAGQTQQAAGLEIDPADIIARVAGTGPGGLPKIVPLFRPWRELLAPLRVKGYVDDSAAGAVVLTQLGDDRAFVLAQVGVREPHQIECGDWVRLCFLDSPGKGLPYAKDFLKGFETRHCYDRFYSLAGDPAHTTRYLVCGYAMVVVGATPAGSESTAASSFFRQVLSRHVRRQYFDLVLIALLQKTALKTLSDRIAAVTNPNSQAVTEMQKDVLAFTHRYWFEDISAQLQAQELFELLRSQMRLRDLYRQLSQEAREANALAAQEKQHRLGNAAQSLNIIAAVGLAASVIVGFFGMNVFEEGHAFMVADRPFFWAALITMSGLFFTLFVLRDWLIRTFSTDRVGRRGMVAMGVIVMVYGLAQLLRSVSGP